MANQHRRRTLVGRILDWYHGSSRAFKAGRFRPLVGRNARRSRAGEQGFCSSPRIPQSAAITCVKPSGTVSQLVDAASGIHARHNDYYIRTVRGDNKDPLTQFLKEQGMYSEACVMKPDSTTVFSFAMKSPDNAVTRTQMSAIEQLELWKVYAIHWCEHKPSVTITVKEDEWMDVGAWMYENFDVASGVSFLPHSDHTYQQAPYQDIEADEYLEWQVERGRIEIDWAALSEYEKEDNTTGSRELALPLACVKLSI